MYLLKIMTFNMFKRNFHIFCYITLTISKLTISHVSSKINVNDNHQFSTYDSNYECWSNKGEHNTLRSWQPTSEILKRGVQFLEFKYYTIKFSGQSQIQIPRRKYYRNSGKVIVFLLLYIQHMKCKKVQSVELRLLTQSLILIGSTMFGATFNTVTLV